MCSFWIIEQKNLTKYQICAICVFERDLWCTYKHFDKSVVFTNVHFFSLIKSVNVCFFFGTFFSIIVLWFMQLNGFDDVEETFSWTLLTSSIPYKLPKTLSKFVEIYYTSIFFTSFCIISYRSHNFVVLVFYSLHGLLRISVGYFHLSMVFYIFPIFKIYAFYL